MKTIKTFFVILFFFAFTDNVISQDNENSINSSFDYKTISTPDYIYGQGYKETKHWIYKDCDTDYLFDILAKGKSANLNVIDGAYKAFGLGNIPAVLAVMDANIVWNEAEGNAYADGNPYIGPEAVLNGVFTRIGEEHEYFKLTDIVLHEMSNDQVLATLRYQGKLKRNGVIFDAQVAHLWTLKDGKVVGFQQYVDTKQLNDAASK